MTGFRSLGLLSEYVNVTGLGGCPREGGGGRATSGACMRYRLTNEDHLLEGIGVNDLKRFRDLYAPASNQSGLLAR